MELWLFKTKICLYFSQYFNKHMLSARTTIFQATYSNFFNIITACDCNPDGGTSLACDSAGRCIPCKSGYTGEKCQDCQIGYYKSGNQCKGMQDS